MINQPTFPAWSETGLPHHPPETRTNYRFSGHQTFPLRIAWLPKAVAEIAAGRDPLSNIDEGITVLGLGKNMVEALRCWIDAFQIATKKDGTWSLTTLGELIFSPSQGLDPYLEDHSTSWLLHWLISTNRKAPFFAWECLFNRWPSPEFSASPVLEAFHRELEKNSRAASMVTLRQHLEVFVHSYRPIRRNAAEDHLDCALSVLDLIQEAGGRRSVTGKWEPIYSFDTSPKDSIPQQLFAFFIHDWWNNTFPAEQTVPLMELVAGDHSPGRILKMPEAEILERVADLTSSQPKTFQITESANLRQFRRFQLCDSYEDLQAAYTDPKFL